MHKQTEKPTAMLTRVFSEDPMFIHLFNPDKEGKRMHLVMRFLYEMALQRGIVATTGEAQENAGPQALLAYYAPKKFPVAIWRVVPLLLRLIPEALSSTISIKNVIYSLRVLGALEKKHPKAPHWYISMIAVDQSAQGQGLGAKILQPFLAAADQRGEAVYLESSNPKNHNFYKRHGFEITEEFRFSSTTPPVWCMLRAARNSDKASSH